MDNYTLKLSDDELTNIFIEDPLKRTESILSLVRWINQIDDSKIVSIEGNWGSGKTVAVKQLELVCKKNNIIKEWYEKHKKDFTEEYKVLKIDDYRCDTFKVMYYNAWENDSSESPLLNLVYNLATENGIEIRDEKVGINFFKIINDLFSVAKTVRPELKVIDFLLQYIEVKDTDERKAFKTVKDERTIHDVIELFIKKISYGKKIVIVIDELDRCRPEFALKLIESIKHYFNIDNVITLLVMNKREMCSIIKKYYGDGFNSDEYLDKVVDLHLQLPEIDKKNYLLYLLGNGSYNAVIVESMLNTIKKYNLDMRQINRFLGAVNSVIPIDVIVGNRGIVKNFYTDDISATINYFMRSYMIVYMIGLRLFDSNLYESLINGNCADDFFNDYFINDNSVESLLHMRSLLGTTLSNDGNKNIIRMIYYRCFKNQSLSPQHAEISDSIDENIPIVMNTCNLLKLIKKYQY